MFVKLTDNQITSKKEFVQDYIGAANAADGSSVDASANVTSKNVATLEAEMNKDFNIQVNRSLVTDIIRAKYGDELAAYYVKDIEEHLLYIHDETTLKPYCASVSLYPFLFKGTKCVGGTSDAPKNLKSFCGSFINLVYLISGQFAGAIATVEFLMYFDYYARKDFGTNYLNDKHATREVKQALQGIIHSMNEPAAARGYQSVFWNISMFDEHYFDELFGTFVFPDGTESSYESVQKLQEVYMKYFRYLRTKELLTFPVETASYLVDKETREPLDADFMHLLTKEMSKGHSFFHYESDQADSLASCCRLRNELQDNQFSYTLGAGGVSTGSLQVITINFNRLIQTQENENGGAELLDRVHKYLDAHRELQERMLRAKLLPVYDAGFISMDKQFLTIGINGMLESYEYCRDVKHKGEDIKCYKEYLATILGKIKESNTAARATYGHRFNTEFVPAENLGVKNAKWDKEDGLYVPRDCYNSYFYPVEALDIEWNILDKMAIHGSEVSEFLDGGAALHLNLGSLPTEAEAETLIKLNAQYGVPYWTTNVLSTVCKDCGYINPETKESCSKCNSKNIGYATRIIGYLKMVENFSQPRQEEASRRGYRIEGGTQYHAKHF